MTTPRLAAWNVRGFNSPDKVWACKQLVHQHHLELFSVLENRINESSLLNPWFCSNHRIFDNEDSCHNFNLAKPGRIWIKWDQSLIQFKPSTSTSQMISGDLYKGDDILAVLSVVYASNSQAERINLWDDLRVIGSHISSPWLILGDFNCCLCPEEKSGGSILLPSQIWDLKSLIFDMGLLDLASTGLQYTWFNQRANDPIHLKLDRMLINDKWLESYPHSYYEVLNPSCSDHSPIVLFTGHSVMHKHRFLFKNFWTKQDRFWSDLLSIFAQPIHGNPIHGLYFKLNKLKQNIKLKDWASSSLLSAKLSSLKEHQAICLDKINEDPLNPSLNQTLKCINAQILECSSSWTNWVLQRAKLKWLSQGEDDLKFLYARIRKRRNHSTSPLVANADPIVRKDLISSIILHFERLFNAPTPDSLGDSSSIPHGKVMPFHLAALLTVSVSDEEIKAAIFNGNSNSTPGPDGFNFEFYKATWLMS
ncbi:uncharacterized protein LOC114580776 [Dendrobium catenatum]|uniref:uncharacterized protein LOC114580776 n=1 Tax=Dendrobium catenatum TaxID=906689 RepID=UPI00109F3BB7|nr:uncharacterized protein LOC114580776 [Dendrobium catenatum]